MEFHSLSDELMRAYQYVDFSFCKVVEQQCCLLGSAGTCEVVYSYWHVFESRGERVVVLVCEHCCRHEHCYLFAVAGSLESCSHCHLCLSEAHVAAH